MPEHKKIMRIGLFDSGIGGLTVLQELLASIPAEYIYVADTANVPYGNKTPQQIIDYSHAITTFLTSQKIDALVVACHTASAFALTEIKKRFPALLIIGTIEQTAQQAVSQTRAGRIGVIATQASINSSIHQTKILAINPGLNVFEQACPMLVPLLEAPTLDKPMIKIYLNKYLAPLREHQIDTLILGCTHYPLLAQEIQFIMGPQVKLISCEKTIAQELSSCVPFALPEMSKVSFYATRGAQALATKIASILHCSVTVEHLDYAFLKTYS